MKSASTFLLSSILILIFGFNKAAAQNQNQVSGTVTEASTGNTLPGVNVLIKGTTIGTSTDAEGNYSLSVSGTADTLVFSFVGYRSTGVAINGRSTVNVTLQSQAISGEELVVTGYGEAKRKELTSSISSVDGEELSKSTVSNVSESLQGKVSGIQIVSNSGSPGSNSTIVIRGITSNQSVNPLIVVDGVPQPPGYSLNSLNDQNIKSVDVLKDASSAAIYGARASNGVVLVTTKRGSKGKANVTFDASYGVQTIDQFEVAGAQEYAQVMNQRILNDDPNAEVPYPDAASLGAGTDWTEEVFAPTAPLAELNVGISGGTDNVTYAGNVGYYRENSQSSVGKWERISARFNIDYNVSEKFTIRQDFNPKLINSSDTNAPFFGVQSIDPLTGVYLPENQRAGKNRFSIFQRSNNLVGNPVAALERSFAENTEFSFVSNTQLEYEPIQSLNLKSQFGLTVGQYRRDDYNPEFFIDVLEQSEQSTAFRNMGSNFNYVWNNTATYNADIADHSFTILGGVVLERNRNNVLEASRDGGAGADKNLRYISLATGDNISVEDGENVNSIFSLLSRLRYNYREKYFLTAAIRRDASSNFPVDNNYAIFPSISGAWEITQENFIGNIPYVNSLRLKAGYGEVGNQEIPGDATIFEVANGDYIFGPDQQRVVTAYLSQFGNEGLRWETVRDNNIGVDLTMFENKFNLSVERYRRTSIDNLYPTSYPQYAGSPSPVWQNVGSFESNGWDISANYNNQKDAFSYNLGLTFSTNSSKAVELAPGQDQLLAGNINILGQISTKITRIGDQVGLFYGYQTDGLFRSDEEVSNYVNGEGGLIQPNASAGDLKFVDINGDGVINQSGDLTTIGNPFPDFNAGFNVNMGYKRWDMTMQMYGTFGNDVFNRNKIYRTSGLQQTNVQKGLLEDAWSPENRDASIPRLTSADPNGNFKVPSDYFIEDGSYLRMKNIQLGYRIPFRSVKNLRVYISAQNLFTITTYSGLDPEVRTGGGFINAYGVDTVDYPSTRLFLIGVDMSL